MNEVSVMVFEHHRGLVPLLRHKLMGNVQTVQNQVEDIDIISRWLAIGIEEFERSEIPVADDGQRVMLGVTIEFLGLSRRNRPETQQDKQYVVESFVHCVVTLLFFSLTRCTCRGWISRRQYPSLHRI